MSPTVLALAAASSGRTATASAASPTAMSASRSQAKPATRTIVETAACPPELKRGDGVWAFSDFKVQRMLGEGNMSSVLHCVDIRSMLAVVVKLYHKGKMNSMNVKQVSREIELHACLLHPNIIRLYAAFEDPEGIYLVEEFAPKGDLYGDLSRRGGHMTEAHVAKAVLLPFLSALSYMHSQGVVHRDIKPENIMLGEDSEVKLGDFGLAINILREKPVSRVGTLDYMPPEIVRLPYGGRPAQPLPGGGEPPAEGSANYGLPADVWCVGVLAYELLVGGPPFEAETKDATYTRILKTEPHIPKHLHEHVRDFISQASALRKDPSRRPTVAQLLRHPWLRSYQRPRSMHVLEAAYLRANSLTAGQQPPAKATAAQEQLHPAAEDAAAAALNPAAAATQANAGAGSAAAAAAAAAGSGKSPLLSRAISFNSSLTGRFTPMPSKPAALNQMVLQQQQHSSGSISQSAGLPADIAVPSEAGPAAEQMPDGVAAVGVGDGETIPALAPEGSRSKLTLRVAGADPGTPDSVAAAAAAAAGFETDSASAGSTPGSQSSSGGLIRALMQGGAAAEAAEGSPRTVAGAGSPRSTFAAFRRKLSSKSYNVLSSLAGSDRSSGRETSQHRLSAGAATARASGGSAGRRSGAGRMSGVHVLQPPSMVELLSPAPDSAGAQGTSAGPRPGSSKLLSAFGRKLSQGKQRLSGGFGRGGSMRSASRLSGLQGSGLPGSQA